MPDVDSLIPEITDDDIDGICTLMGLDGFDAHRRAFLKRRTTVDVSACPGSGKTTLIVAKLAILAGKMAAPDAGNLRPVPYQRGPRADRAPARKLRGRTAASLLSSLH